MRTALVADDAHEIRTAQADFVYLTKVEEFPEVDADHG
jgi:hypothetical protein